MGKSPAWNEQHFSEIEKVLLYVSEARERAEKAHRALERAGAEPHLVSALKQTEATMKAEHRRLMQSTYFAVPDKDKLFA